jgi:tripartite-type tricarboxylate transporter receptor subunit TctC
LFEQVAAVQMQHVPYKGGGPALTDLIGGQVQLSFQTPVASISHVKSGRLRALAITGDKRSPSMPQVPTFAEAGLPGFSALAGYQGLIAPAGTPIAIVNKLSAEIAKIVTMPDFIQKLAEQAAEPFYTTPEQYAALVKADTARFIKVIKDANIKVD